MAEGSTRICYARHVLISTRTATSVHVPLCDWKYSAIFEVTLFHYTLYQTPSWRTTKVIHLFLDRFNFKATERVLMPIGRVVQAFEINVSAT